MWSVAFPMKTLDGCICPFVTSLSIKKIGIRHLHSKQKENENPTSLLNTIFYTSHKRAKRHFNYRTKINIFKDLNIVIKMKGKVILHIKPKIFLLLKNMAIAMDFHWNISNNDKYFFIYMLACYVHRIYCTAEQVTHLGWWFHGYPFGMSLFMTWEKQFHRAFALLI